MNLQTIIKTIDGNLVTNSCDELEFEHGLTSDLMSDILRFDFDKGVLITGLNNLQTIRTAEMSDMHCVIIGRNKKVSQDMIDLANKNKIAIVESNHTIFNISGRLFQGGLKPIY